MNHILRHTWTEDDDCIYIGIAENCIDLRLNAKIVKTENGKWFLLIELWKESCLSVEIDGKNISTMRFETLDMFFFFRIIKRWNKENVVLMRKMNDLMKWPDFISLIWRIRDAMGEIKYIQFYFPDKEIVRSQFDPGWWAGLKMLSKIGISTKSNERMRKKQNVV